MSAASLLVFFELRQHPRAFGGQSFLHSHWTSGNASNDLRVQSRMSLRLTSDIFRKILYLFVATTRDHARTLGSPVLLSLLCKILCFFPGTRSLPEAKSLPGDDLENPGDDFED